MWNPFVLKSQMLNNFSAWDISLINLSRFQRSWRRLRKSSYSLQSAWEWNDFTISMSLTSNPLAHLLFELGLVVYFWLENYSWWSINPEKMCLWQDILWISSISIRLEQLSFSISVVCVSVCVLVVWFLSAHSQDWTHRMGNTIMQGNVSCEKMRTHTYCNTANKSA